MIQYYLRLGLEPGANIDEIKDSFRLLAKRYHPDAGSGNAHMFARIKEAYDALNNSEQRNQFERIYQGSQHHQTVWQNLARRINKLREKAGWPTHHTNHTTSSTASAGMATQTRPTASRERSEAPGTANQKSAGPNTTTNTASQEPVITRLMSIALPRGGQVVLEDIGAQWIIEPTTPETMWNTTLDKFGRDDPERLAQHVIQMRVTGRRGLARGVELRATDTGVGVRALRENNGNKNNADMNLFLNPLTIRATIPIGTKLVIRNLGGTISLGDLQGEVRAILKGRTTLRAGTLTKAALTLHDKSRVIISRMKGDVDVLMTDSSKTLLNGRIGRLRAVVEKDGQLEVLAPTGKLHAEVNGKGLIHAKSPVDTVHCNVFGNGHVHIAELRSAIVSNTRDNGRVDVKKKPSFVPTSGLRPQRRTGA